MQQEKKEEQQVEEQKNLPLREARRELSMRKLLLVGLALMLMFSFFGGCGGTEEEVADDQVVEEQVEEDADSIETEEEFLKEAEERISAGVDVPKELEELVNHFENEGLDLGEYSVKMYDIIGASAGFGLEVGGQEIELYYFDPAKTDEEVLGYLDDAHDTGELYIADWESSIPVYTNGNYLLIMVFHPEEDSILEAFESF